MGPPTRNTEREERWKREEKRQREKEREREREMSVCVCVCVSVSVRERETFNIMTHQQPLMVRFSVVAACCSVL